MLAGSLTTEDSAFEDVGSFSTGDSDLSLTCDVLVAFSSLSAWDLHDVRDVNLSRDILADEDLSLSFDVYSLDSNDFRLLKTDTSSSCYSVVTNPKLLATHPTTLTYLTSQLSGNPSSDGTLSSLLSSCTEDISVSDGLCTNVTWVNTITLGEGLLTNTL